MIATNRVDPAFVDTNVYIYAFAGVETEKVSAARNLLRILRDEGSLRSSTQVLQELYNTLTTKKAFNLAPATALAYLTVVEDWPIVEMTAAMIRTAAELSASSRISFWDALIVVAAKKAGAKRLYTEDLSHGQKILGVEVVNPFISC